MDLKNFPREPIRGGQIPPGGKQTGIPGKRSEAPGRQRKIPGEQSGLPREQTMAPGNRSGAPGRQTGGAGRQTDAAGRPPVTRGNVTDESRSNGPSRPTGLGKGRAAWPYVAVTGRVGEGTISPL